MRGGVNRRNRGHHSGRHNGPSRGPNPNRSGQHMPVRFQMFDSNGPEVRVRGNPQQICDKYTALERDARASGDHVLAEALLQHAEHYQRLLNAEPRQQQPAMQPAFSPDVPNLPPMEGEMLEGEATVERVTKPVQAPPADADAA
ncbi:MAG: DUF4167 domain-containing protein [Dongiaceae bacterium]